MRNGNRLVCLVALENIGQLKFPANLRVLFALHQLELFTLSRALRACFRAAVIEFRVRNGIGNTGPYQELAFFRATETKLHTFFHAGNVAAHCRSNLAFLNALL
jgi:hypothetical protein